MEACLLSCVKRHLDLFCYANATFLAERLHAGFPSEANRLILAQCYFRADQPQRAYHLLKGTKSGQCRYLLAIVCLQLHLLPEAEAALTPRPSEQPNSVPNGGAGLYLLGLICRRTDRRQSAIQHLSAALSLDPFLWCAYEELCQLGAEEEASRAYGDAAMAAAEQLTQQAGAVTSSGNATSRQNLPDEELRRSGSPQHMRTPLGVQAGQVQNGSIASPLPASPSAFSTPPPSSVLMFSGTQAPLRKADQRPVQAVPTDNAGATGEGSPRLRTVGTQGGGGRRKFVDEGKLRKVAGRLFAEPAALRRSTRLAEGGTRVSASGRSGNAGVGVERNSTATASERIRSGRRGDTVADESGRRSTEFMQGPASDMAGPTSSSSSSSGRGGVGQAAVRITGSSSRMGASGLASRTAPGAETPVVDNRTQAQSLGAGPGGRESGSAAMAAAEGTRELMSLLRILSHALRLQCMLRSQEALEVLQQLSPQHYATSWVLCLVGRAHYEMVEYAQAERAFSWARRVAPYGTHGLAIYSTVLYHMKKKADLSYLAQEALALDRLSPESWCVMGNCTSAQGEHEAALRFFQRALQIDPHFAYAHTLCGHEHVAMEQFEEGVTCYRAALRLDSRHYNAWYGLGSIYLRQEKPELAEYHFRRALQIHERSSVLRCYLGVALHALKRNGEALEELQVAAEGDPRNPLPLYQRCVVLLAEGQLEEALEGAKELCQLASGEASAYFLLGRVYARMEQPAMALLQLSVALDLKPPPSEATSIKAVMEKLPVQGPETQVEEDAEQ